MNGPQVVPLHLDEVFANPKLLERLGRQDERAVDRCRAQRLAGTRRNDALPIRQSKGRLRFCFGGSGKLSTIMLQRWPRLARWSWSTWCGLSCCLHLVDAVWAWLAQAVKSAMVKIPCVPAVEPCEADQWWMGSVHPPAIDRKVLFGTDRYIGLQDGAEPEAVH